MFYNLKDKKICTYCASGYRGNIAADEETILIIECKSSNKRRVRPLKQDIAEFSDFSYMLQKTLNYCHGKTLLCIQLLECRK